MKIRDIIGEIAGLGKKPYQSKIAKQHDARKKKSERLQREKEQVKKAEDKLRQQKTDLARVATS